MSKVTKEEMLAWLYAIDDGWRENIKEAIQSLVEKYGDLTDDVVTATSIKHVPWR